MSTTNTNAPLKVEQTFDIVYDCINKGKSINKGFAMSYFDAKHYIETNISEWSELFDRAAIVGNDDNETYYVTPAKY